MHVCEEKYEVYLCVIANIVIFLEISIVATLNCCCLPAGKYGEHCMSAKKYEVHL